MSFLLHLVRFVSPLSLSPTLFVPSLLLSFCFPFFFFFFFFFSSQFFLSFFFSFLFFFFFFLHRHKSLSKEKSEALRTLLLATIETGIESFLKQENDSVYASNELYDVCKKKKKNSLSSVSFPPPFFY